MDDILRVYFEDTYEYLQNAETCLIRLEETYNEKDINELFRYAHSIKGSSASLGFDDIANITHKTEDMLDAIRKGRLVLDTYIVSLCFNAFDNVLGLVNLRNNATSTETYESAKLGTQRIQGEIETILNGLNEKPENREQPLSFRLDLAETRASIDGTSYFVYITFDENVQMLEVRLLMLIQAINEIGSLVYTSIPRDGFDSTENYTYECFIKTHRDEDDLLGLLDVGDIKSIKIVDVVAAGELQDTVVFDSGDIAFLNYFFNDFIRVADVLFNVSGQCRADNVFDLEMQGWFNDLYHISVEELKKLMAKSKFTKYKDDIAALFELIFFVTQRAGEVSLSVLVLIQKVYLDILKEIYALVRNKAIFRVIKLKEENGLSSLQTIIDSADHGIFTRFIVDISQLQIIEPEEIKSYIELKRRLLAKGTNICLVNRGIYRKRIYNIFDSLRDIENIVQFDSELEAIIECNLATNSRCLCSFGSNSN